MKEGLLLNGVGIGCHQFPVYQGHQMAILVLPDGAYSPLIGPDATPLVAEVASYLVIQLLPETGLSNSSEHCSHCLRIYYAAMEYNCFAFLDR
jgi:hypothetical protein